MTFFQHALNLDIAAAAEAFDIQRILQGILPKETLSGKIVSAADAYEETLNHEERISDAYINLSFLYWQSTDFGFNSAASLDLEFIKRAEERYQEVLQTANHIFPDKPEISFWSHYFAWALGDSSFVEECNKLIDLPGCSLVPFFYLFSESGGRQFAAQTMKLLDHCKEVPTLKNCYIQSVIEGVKGQQF